MLEYYTMNANYMDSLVLTEELFSYLSQNSVITADSFERITVSDAFAKWAGFDLFKTAKEGASAMEEQARKLGLEPMPDMTVHQLYDLIFIHSVEPQLKTEKPIALLDYPAFVPCLAKKSPNGQTVERWELYFNGIELANCYSEENDPQAVKEFFISEEANKNKNAVVKHNADHDYWKIFEKFPRCSGTAIGLDRLIMALTGKTTIDGVLPFLGF
jgi:lysyl-tRNA synthetase class 2